MTDSNLYAKMLNRELLAWERAMLKPPGYISRATQSMQSATRSLVPQKVQDILTASIQKMTKMIMSGSSLLTSAETVGNISLAESDYLVEQAFKVYNKVAIAQGVSFGLGGILLGLADFPALLSIKVKFLFDCAKYYGFDVNQESERLFMLYVFQLAFCSDERRIELFPILKMWDDNPAREIDWEAFQVAYRDYIDLAKLLQLLPVVGSIVGGTANHRLLKTLKTTAMNCYRLRILRRNRHGDGR